MLRIAICDDEKQYLAEEEELVKAYLEKQEMEYQIDGFSSGQELLRVHQGVVDYKIVFLDIKMDGVDGMEVAKQIREWNSETFIIFITSFVEYSLQGYEVGAFRYIMKDEMEWGVGRCLEDAFKKMKVHKESFKFMEGESEVYIHNILYISSENRLVTFHMVHSKDKQYHMDEKLDYLEEQLLKYDFLRLRKSHLVNMRYISRINDYKAYLTTNQTIVIPKERYREVKDEFEFYRGKNR